MFALFWYTYPNPFIPIPVPVPTGKEAVEGQGKMDAAAMYAMIFGSELFESIIGELSVATHVKQMIDPDGDTSTELLGFKQRKREVRPTLMM